TNISPNVPTVWGVRDSTLLATSLQRFSIGLRSGEYRGKSSTVTVLLCNHILTGSVLNVGALSWRKYQGSEAKVPILSRWKCNSTEGINSVSNMSLNPLPVRFSSNTLA